LICAGAYLGIFVGLVGHGFGAIFQLDLLKNEAENCVPGDQEAKRNFGKNE
jgi:hypothetical protein